MPTPTRRNAQPEHLLQGKVRRMLLERLPADIFWIASMSGVRLTPGVRAKAKSAGCLNRGWPDLQFLLPGGRVKFIELKAGEGSLRPEQKDFRDQVEPHDMWALARSVADVERALVSWGIELRPDPWGPGE